MRWGAGTTVGKSQQAAAARGRVLRQAVARGHFCKSLEQPRELGTPRSV